MRTILDTNVISEFMRPRPDPRVIRWGNRVNPDECHLSVLTLGEIRRGVDIIGRRDPSQAQTLDRWLRQLQNLYADRILPIGSEIALEWGRLGSIPKLSPIDALLAATASHHRLIVVTRNISDFRLSGVPLLNPFEFEG